jgi:hypothetical protein
MPPSGVARNGPAVSDELGTFGWYVRAKRRPFGLRYKRVYIGVVPGAAPGPPAEEPTNLQIYPELSGVRMAEFASAIT